MQMHLTDEDLILVIYPDGQRITIPANEPGRIITILRAERERARPVDKLLTFRREFQAAFTHDDIVKKGAEVRQKHETQTAERKEREKRQRLKRAEKREKLAEAEKILAICGL